MIALGGMAPGPLARLTEGAGALERQVALLSRQSSEGRRADVYGDLGVEAPRAISLRGALVRGDTYGEAIDRALGRAAVGQDTLERLTAISNDFRAQALLLVDGDPTRIAATAAGAQAALHEVAGLLNNTYAGEYVLGGSDVRNPPVPDPGGILASGMATQIAAAVAGLVPGGAAAVNAATLAAAQDNTAGVTPFSVFQTTGAGATEARRGVPVADGIVVESGLFAARNATPGASTGETAGAWSRDLLRGLMTLAALVPAQAQDPLTRADYLAIVDTVQRGLDSSTSALALEQGALGAAEQQMDRAAESHADVAVQLKLQLSDIEEVDLAATLTALQDTRTRLEASWKALSMISELSLTKFLR
ncbi:flagellin [Humitalea sp. 24SJ18S-53]|uniref:flagellin n=1 Tax=Humitalea sp. 24SJ18S-53 TaxID=3422307 RepID=UPI003D67A75D